LSYAHVNGIVHSDLKPGNIFITDSGRAKVIDFGISRAIRQAGDEDLTRFDPGSLNALTPAYASIEMIESGSDPDPRDDIFALGIIFYEILTGRHPFNGWMATRAFREGLKPQRPVTLTSRQWKGLQRALRFERAQRTSSVTQFIDDLRPPKFKFPRLSLGRLSFAKFSLPRFSFKINVYRVASIFALFGFALVGLFYLTQSSPPSFAPVKPPLAANSVVPATPPAPKTPAPETKVVVTDTSILGRWCGDEGTLSVTPVALKTNAGTPTQKTFAIYKIALAEGVVTLMAETENHHIAQTEFGDFSSSLDSMSELRTRVDSESWTEARHRFRRC
jgi:serine/threonine protein kinase